MNKDKTPLPDQEQGLQTKYPHYYIGLPVLKCYDMPDTVCGDFEQDKDDTEIEQIECLSEYYGDVLCSVCLNRNNCIKLEAA